MNNFDEIMEKITSGLTGDAPTDLVYLNKQCEEYKEHPLAKEIIRACSRMMFKLIPEDKRKELDKIIDNEMNGIDATLDEVQFNVYKKEYDKALHMLEHLIEKLEDSGMSQDDSVSEYHDFGEPFEEIIYDYIHKPTKTLRPASFPFARIYLQYGSLLFEVKRFKEAQQALEKARRWNPSNASIAFEYIETYKALGDMDSFYRLTRDTFAIAFRPNDVALCYRNLGYYFVEQKDYEAAQCCYLLSLLYDSDAKNAQAELYYISQKSPIPLPEPSPDHLFEVLEKHHVPVHPDNDLIGLSVAYGKHAYGQKDMEAALYFLTIAYGLTQDDEIGKIVESLQKEKEKMN